MFKLHYQVQLDIITLIDDSNGTNENVTTAGRVYNIVSGALNIGTSLTATVAQYSDTYTGQGYGLFYPDMGSYIVKPKCIISIS
jgi:hypothetical protein